MTEITKSITFLNEYKQLKKALEEGKTPVLAVGLAAIHKANLAAALGADLKRPVLVLRHVLPRSRRSPARLSRSRPCRRRRSAPCRPSCCARLSLR